MALGRDKAFRYPLDQLQELWRYGPVSRPDLCMDPAAPMLTHLLSHSNPFLFSPHRLLLLNQFHDVIPGSCIEMVVEDALRYYQGTLF